jgi:hypothetical protein
MVDIVQNTFASGEISPHLYGRTDLAKYHTGAMWMENFFVDYRGGASNRQGTQFIGTTYGLSPARLARFDFGLDQTYVLVFTAASDPVGGEIEFIKNPRTPSHVNGSNADFIPDPITPSQRYIVFTPYLRTELPDLKFSQSADVFVITHPNHPPMQLIRLADDNWTLSEYTIGSGATAPSGLTGTITGLPTGSTDPQNTNYNYLVTAVDQNGDESPRSNVDSLVGINIASTQGTVDLKWTGVDDAQYYFVYRAIPSPGGVLVPVTASFGFLGIAYGPRFADSNIIADFSTSPPIINRPFKNKRVIGYSISNPGTNYPVGGGTTATITDANGGTASILPIVDSNTAGGLGGVVGFVILDAGHDIADGASIVVSGGGGSGFVGTVHTFPASGAFPRVSGYFQQRFILASTFAQPLTLWGSRPGFYRNFNVSNPTVDSDAFEFSIAGRQVAQILYLVAMPGGLVLFSYDILYTQFGGSIVRDLSYNFFVNIYTGTDVTILSSHLFAPAKLVRWAYQDLPNKIIWAVRDDGILLALTYLKEQDIYGWSRHYTAGSFTDVVTIHEGVEDAVYFVVWRNNIPMIERMASRQTSSIRDAWFLDSAICNPFLFPNAQLFPQAQAQIAGSTNVEFSTDVDVFDPGWVGGRIQGMNNFLGEATITSYNNPRSVFCTIVEPFVIEISRLYILASGSWAVFPQVSIVDGLDHLNGAQVMALVDEKVQGPFNVVAGSVVLTTPGYNWVIGIPYTARLQQVPPEGPQGGLAGRRDRTIATTACLMYSAAESIKIGYSFDTLKPFRPTLSSTDTPWKVPATVAGVPLVPVGLKTGNHRIHVGAKWDTQGGTALQVDDPVPVTVLSFINEIDPGAQK